MGEINFINYSKGERFGDNYKLLSQFFEKYTGEGMQENWHIGRLDWMLNHDYTNPELLPSIGIWKEDNQVVGTVIFDVEMCIRDRYKGNGSKYSRNGFL